MEIQTYIVIQGNPKDGFVHYGPFLTNDDALKWAEEHQDGDWWLIPLEPPHA